MKEDRAGYRLKLRHWALKERVTLGLEELELH